MGRQRPETLERTRPVKVKAVRADASEGIVEALPSITGNLDLQDDVILPGAITVGLREVPKPKMLFDHDWSKITGKSLEAEELLPRDPRLSEMAPDLADRGYGALYVVNELNLAKELARDVLSDIVFFDDEGEWSIGYETLDAEFMETEDGRPFRGLKALIVWEDSFVLFGANRLTRTVGAKGVDGAGVKDRLEHLDDAGRRLVLETLSRNLGIDVKAGVYAVSGGKVVRTGARDKAPQPPVESKEAVAPHSTATDDGEWDASSNRSNLDNDGDGDYYKAAHAWRDPDADEDTKGAWSFIHHFVDSDGEIGAASTVACSTGIGILNGGRGGGPDADWWDDRSSIYSHLSSHIEDAGDEPPELEDASAIDKDGYIEVGAVKVYPRLPGSFEERQERLRDRLDQWAEGRYGSDAVVWTWIVATLPDRVIVGVERQDAEDQFWSIPYVVSDSGEITLGEATQVQVDLTVSTPDPAGALSAERSVWQALAEDHGQQPTVGAFADLSEEAALGEGIVEYAVGGKRFVREWAVDGRGGVALSNLDGLDPVLSKRARSVVERLGLPTTDGELDAEPDPPAVEPVGDLDLLEQEMAAALAGD